ncbi:glycosyltransferase family 39 protein [Microbacterium sp. ASV81]|uniref:Glycosyltransferase family 39 protein n=1 Tax=Microbacterium capsulatum TaxID=3041921 RepID=A0ABU0XFF7_9MICO|nr:glycosyltransferase family 39 protein [Microbacterium sp. ASV81]MDQ4213837.1 glycosyltransferase family 39 protein [Microbacterium sp. ASV81]
MTRSLRPRLWRIAVLSGGVATLAGALGSWIPSFWGDEAASIMSATRTWPELWRLLQTVDGVHGAYYAFLHVWIGLFGASEFSVRLPSAIAVGFLAAGTAVLAGRLGGPRLALIAGLVVAVLPRTTLMAVEARSYAIGSAIAVWLTVLLVHLLTRRRPWWAWAGYAVGLAAGVYVFLYLALLLVVHGLYVVLRHRRALWPWASWAGVGVVLALPIVALAAAERNQIGFLAHRDYITPLNVLALQWFDPVTAFPCWALIVLGVVARIRSRRGDPDGDRLALLAGIWLVLPTVAVLLGSALIAPMYTVRYLSFCTPAAAILIAFGVLALVRGLTRRSPARTRLVTGIAVAVLLAAFVPGWIVQRGPYAKDDSDWREAAAYLHAHARAGDAVVFDERQKHSQNPRLILAVHPADFAGLKDPALIAGFRSQPGLWDRTRPNASLTAADLGSDVWALERGPAAADSPDVRHLESLGYRVVSSHRITVTTLLHLTPGR